MLSIVAPPLASKAPVKVVIPVAFKLVNVEPAVVSIPATLLPPDAVTVTTPR